MFYNKCMINEDYVKSLEEENDLLRSKCSNYGSTIEELENLLDTERSLSVYSKFITNSIKERHSIIEKLPVSVDNRMKKNFLHISFNTGRRGGNTTAALEAFKSIKKEVAYVCHDKNVLHNNIKDILKVEKSIFKRNSYYEYEGKILSTIDPFSKLLNGRKFYCVIFDSVSKSPTLLNIIDVLTFSNTVCVFTGDCHSVR